MIGKISQFDEAILIILTTSVILYLIKLIFRIKKIAETFKTFSIYLLFLFVFGQILEVTVVLNILKIKLKQRGSDNVRKSLNQFSFLIYIKKESFNRRNRRT